MSQYGETNPHFWPQQQPDFPGPYQHLEPEIAQPWEPHPDPNPHQPERIQLRPRQRPSHSPPPRRQGRPQPPLEAYPPRGPPDHHAHQPQPAPPSRRHPSPHSHPAPGPAPPQSEPPPRRHPSPHSHPARPPPQSEPQAQSQSKPPSRHQRRPHHVSFEQGPSQPPPHENLMYPTPNKTKPITWFGAVFCVILWLVIILGGLLVLVIYLIYRPQIPRFEISSATLNAAYLDMGSLLNADLTILANFTNPNKKVNVDFSYVTLRLYFDKLLIANQYVGPFSAANTGSRLANVEFVSSQIRLPPTVIQQLVTQIQKNRVMFEVDGVFHARSNFGSLLRYSYWLYGRCIIEMTGPPTGVMIASKCRTRE